jgi:hypothetical protein
LVSGLLLLLVAVLFYCGDLQSGITAEAGGIHSLNKSGWGEERSYNWASKLHCVFVWVIIL